ncbi:MAG: sulfite exporter TauE/SafE family protein [Candidatus Kapaibacteriales bacterium]
MDFDLISYSILFGAGFLAGVINVVSGGGSTLTLPSLLFLGLDAPTSNGTNRIGIFIQTLTAIREFRKHPDFDLRLSFKMSMATVPGALIGSFYSIGLGDEEFRIVLGSVLFVILILLFSPNASKVYDESDRKTELTIWHWLGLVLLGVYGGFIQVGIGFFLMLFLNKALKMNLVEVNIHKVFIVMIYTIPALLVFGFSGYLTIIPGIVLSIGTILGSMLSAKFAIRKGAKFVKYILVFSLIIVIFKLFEVF